MYAVYKNYIGKEMEHKVDRSRWLEDLKALEDNWMCDLGTVLGPQGLNRNNHILWRGPPLLFVWRISF